MGGGSFNAGSYRAFASSTTSKSTAEVFTSRSIHPDLNPFGVKIRESRDSVDSPNATPLIVGVDVTGSMGMLADALARKGLGTLFEGVLGRKPISDPHVMFMAIGDANYDQAPLQVSQFEADNRIVEQLTKIWLEGNGGGNGWESYNLPWYFAALHTVHDSIEKRGKRGYLFTVGDEEAPENLTREQITKFIGDTPQVELSTKEILQLAQRSYDVFHVVVREGSHGRHPRTMSSWKELLGDHVIELPDHHCLSEVIVSAIEVAEGGDASVSAKGWGVHGGLVHEAVKNIPKGKGPALLGRS